MDTAKLAGTTLVLDSDFILNLINKEYFWPEPKIYALLPKIKKQLGKNLACGLVSSGKKIPLKQPPSSYFLFNLINIICGNKDKAEMECRNPCLFPCRYCKSGL